jgi:hypothetical protein
VISLDFVIGLTFAGVFTAASVAAIALGVRLRRATDDEYGDRRFFGAVAIVAGSVVLAVTLSLSVAGFWPYDMEYHRYRHVAGVVDQTEARMLADGGGGTTQQYAVRLREDASIYRCDDSRCSLLKPGDRLSLWCIREWVYASTPGWGCQFDHSEAAA